MPGSPYVKDKPRGLLTWPDLLKWIFFLIIPLTFVIYWYGYLLEWLLIITILSFLRILVKR